MKRIFSAILAAGMSVYLFSCEPPSSSEGGSLFSMAGMGSSVQKWDMVFALETPFCEKGIPGSGGSMAPLTGGLFPAVQVSSNGLEYDAEIPEVTIVAYAVNDPSFVQAGDTVHMEFTYRAAADGEHGDYFLVRIIDGELFRVPVERRKEAMAAGDTVTVTYNYQAEAEGFAALFIAGLSSPDDSLFLDQVKVRAGGLEIVNDPLDDDFSQPQLPVSEVAFRALLVPASPAGGLYSAAPLTADSSASLEIRGGRYVALYGQGATMDDISGMLLTYSDPDFLDPFFGQSQLMAQGGMFTGDYTGFDNADPEVRTCTESGYALIVPDPQGNADLSGQWTLTIDAYCADGDSVHETMPDPVFVQRMLIAFVGAPFQDPGGNLFDQFYGTSMGDNGLFLLAAGATSAQLLGSYDPATSVFAGQMLGAILKPDGTTCELRTDKLSTFTALITPGVPIPQ